MDENRINERIRSAYSHATPDCLDKILASCEDRKGTVINMNERKKNRFVPVAIAAALVLAMMRKTIFSAADLKASANVPILASAGAACRKVRHSASQLRERYCATRLYS